MKKEDVRSEGELNVYRRRFLGNVRVLRLCSCPCPYVFISLSFLRLGARHGVSWRWPDPHAFKGPLDVVIRSTCHFPVPRLAACPLVREDPTYLIHPHAQQHALILSPEFIYFPSFGIRAPRSLFPDMFPCSC